jgi:DNA repair protein RadC
MQSKESTYVIPIYRLQLVKEAEAEARPISSPQELAEQMSEIALADREHMVCFHLDTKNRPVSRETVSIGTLDQAILSPREVFKAALLSNARSVILAHNHPSGETAPSPEDDSVTERLARAGRLLDIPLLDHVIVGPDGRFYSYREQNPLLLKGGN